MAKKRAKKVEATAEKAVDPATVKPVRLDLSLADHARLERLARKRGLNKASCARMVILEWMEEQEGQ